MNISEKDHYFTSDFANASALFALGFNLLFLDRTSGDGRVSFIFQRDPGIVNAAEEHFAGLLNISTMKYFSSQRILKSRLHNA